MWWLICLFILHTLLAGVSSQFLWSTYRLVKRVSSCFPPQVPLGIFFVTWRTCPFACLNVSWSIRHDNCRTYPDSARWYPFYRLTRLQLASPGLWRIFYWIQDCHSSCFHYRVTPVLAGNRRRKFPPWLSCYFYYFQDTHSSELSLRSRARERINWLERSKWWHLVGHGWRLL